MPNLRAFAANLGINVLAQGVWSGIATFVGSVMTAVAGISAFLTNAPVYIWFPLVLVGIAATVFIVKSIKSWNIGPTSVAIQDSSQLPGVNLRVVANQHFANQEVTLDGFSYMLCRFENCTIKYAGGQYAMANCEIGPTARLKLEGLGLNGLVLLLRSLNVISHNLQMSQTTYETVGQQPQLPIPPPNG
jgi:hypothetical protein